MCRGPHEWSTQELEFNIQTLRDRLDRATSDRDRHFWEGRLENMEKLLKERAEEGTY